MKRILIAVLLLSSCVNYKKLSRKSELNNVDYYQVYKIDSIRSFYLIYAKKQNRDTLYKIISRKSLKPTKDYERIKIQKSYNFLLRTAIPDVKIGDQILKTHNPYVNCYAFADSTNICLEDYVYDLYYADNVKGLFIKSDRK